MTPNDIKDAVKAAIREEMSEFWIPQSQHFTDHKWIEEVRETFRYAKKAGLWTFVATVVGFTIAVIAVGIKASIK